MSADDVLREVAKLGCTNVSITGGEPMEQYNELCDLLVLLTAEEYNVSIETNGLHSFVRYAFPLNKANFVVDLKKDGPMFISKYVNMGLTEKDFIKIVIGSYEEMYEACSRKKELQDRGVRARFAFSPEFGKVDPNVLLIWMKEFKQMDAVLNFQAHKILNLIEAD
jgi:7-carboxy-7-deazaguanine synthase